MKDQLIVTHPHPGLAWLTISGRGKNNIVDAQLAVELSAACNEINLDTEVRVVILSGPEGRWFCTMPAAGKKVPSSLAAPVASLCCPVIAALDGNICGQAMELALACDIRVASHTARLAFPGIEQGVIPTDGATQRLPRLVGKARAMELLLTGETIGASEALRIGLVNRLVRKADLHGR